jgi:hypothetical protein
MHMVCALFKLIIEYAINPGLSSLSQTPTQTEVCIEDLPYDGHNEGR